MTWSLEHVVEPAAAWEKETGQDLTPDTLPKALNEIVVPGMSSASRKRGLKAIARAGGTVSFRRASPAMQEFLRHAEHFDSVSSDRVRNATMAVLGPDVDVAVKPVASGFRVPTHFEVTVTVGAFNHRSLSGWVERNPKNSRPGAERLLDAVPAVDAVYTDVLPGEVVELLRERHKGWVNETGQGEIILPRTGMFVRVKSAPLGSPRNTLG